MKLIRRITINGVIQEVELTPKGLTNSQITTIRHSILAEIWDRDLKYHQVFVNNTQYDAVADNYKIKNKYIYPDKPLGMRGEPIFS